MTTRPTSDPSTATDADAGRVAPPSAEAALEALPIPVALLGADGHVAYVNRAWPAAVEVLGRHHADVLGSRPELPAGVASALRDTIQAALAGRAGDAVMEFALAGDPPARWLRVRCTPLGGGGAVVLLEDVSVERRRELALALRADHDPLTGLANRHRFLAEGQRMLAVAERQGWGMALLFIDLDDFKAVNDGAGHTFGDAVLQQVARRLRGCTRAGDLLARIGGDEFVALLNDVDGPTGQALAHRYRRAIADPPIVPGSAYAFGASIGMAWFPAAASTLDTLLRLADAAMYRAKNERSGVVAVLGDPSAAVAGDADAGAAPGADAARDGGESASRPT